MRRIPIKGERREVRCGAEALDKAANGMVQMATNTLVVICPPKVVLAARCLVSIGAMMRRASRWPTSHSLWDFVLSKQQIMARSR